MMKGRRTALGDDDLRVPAVRWVDAVQAGVQRGAVGSFRSSAKCCTGRGFDPDHTRYRMSRPLETRHRHRHYGGDGQNGDLGLAVDYRQVLQQPKQRCCRRALETGQSGRSFRH